MARVSVYRPKNAADEVKDVGARSICGDGIHMINMGEFCLFLDSGEVSSMGDGLYL